MAQRTSRCSRAEAERQLAGELGDEPHHRSARVATWLRGELQSSYHLLEEAATPVSTTVAAAKVDPLEGLGDSILKRDFARIAQVQPGKSQDSLVLRTATGRTTRAEASDRTADESRRHPFLRLADPGGGRQSPVEAGHGGSGSRAEHTGSEANELLRARAIAGGDARFPEIRGLEVAATRLRDRAGDRPAECRRRLQPAQVLGDRPGGLELRWTTQGTHGNRRTAAGGR